MRDKFQNKISSFLFSLRSKLLSTSFGSMECAHNALKFLEAQMLGYPTDSIHVQVFVDEVNAFVDSRVAMTVKYLNRIGMKTSASCEEVHDDEWGSVIHLNFHPEMKKKVIDLIDQMAGLEYKVSTDENVACFYFTEINHLKLLRLVLDTYHEVRRNIEAEKRRCDFGRHRWLYLIKGHKDRRQQKGHAH